MLRKIFFTFLFLLLISPQQTSAQVDCCSNHGGNYGCDFSTSKLYCADGTVSATCTCSKSTPTPTSSPTKGPTITPTPSPTIPPCPNFSKYDNTSKSCKCISGYVVNDNSCVTNTEFCWIKYGGNAVFDKDNNNCTCPEGYAWNSDSTKCITLSQLCQDKLGGKSYYNSDNNSCNCYEGYIVQNNKCQPIPTQAISPQVSIVIPTETPKPTATVTPQPTTKPTKTFPTLALKGLGKDFSVKELIRPQENIFVKFIRGIWNFVNNLI